MSKQQILVCPQCQITYEYEPYREFCIVGDFHPVDTIKLIPFVPKEQYDSLLTALREAKYLIDVNYANISVGSHKKLSIKWIEQYSKLIEEAE